MTQARTELADAAARISDEFAMHRTADPYGSVGKWLAFRLEDGSSDHTLYDSRPAAVRHCPDYRHWLFIQVGPWTCTPTEAAALLTANRKLVAAGYKSSDGTDSLGGRDIIKRSTARDQYRQLRALFRGDAPPTNIIHGAEGN